MERRRKYSRHFLQTMQSPPVLLVISLSSIIVFCSYIHYAECVMTFPEERTGVYSLFPDEDLKTGRKRFRFEEETTRSYREGREYSAYRTYPMLPHDRIHRPVDYSGSRQVFDNYRDRDRERDRDQDRERRDRQRERDRQGRVYFDDNYRTNRFDFRVTSRPKPIERPVGPILFETSRRPPPANFYSERFPPPAVGQSKLPIGVATRASGEDVPTRIHIFNPDSTSFGNPRNAGSSDDGSSSERAKGPPSNFVETGPPGPESFMNHEEFLEYQKKISFARFHEQDGQDGTNSAGGNGKKVLFESKEPFEIDGLIPPDKSGENSGKVVTNSQVPLQPTHGQLQTLQQLQQIHRTHDQRQHQRQPTEGQKVRTTGAANNHQRPPPQDGEEERDTGGGEVVDSRLNEKGEEEESENGKSEVTQLPPTHITKSGRAHNHNSDGAGSGGSASAHSKAIVPSVSYNEQVGGTGFRLPTPVVALSYSDEPPNLNGFVPVVPFHLRAEQPRTISLERHRQQQQQHIIPHVPEHSTTTTTTTSTTAKSIPITTTTATSTTTARVKVEKSSFRKPEGTKSSPSFIPVHGTDDNTNDGNVTSDGDDVGVGNPNFSSPASPILHASAGERSNSETHSKVAITKQQELKRLQKQRQLVHQLTHPHPGLVPDSGVGDSSADSADKSDNPGTNINTNIDETFGTYSPTDSIHIPPPVEDTSFPSSSPLPPTENIEPFPHDSISTYIDPDHDITQNIENNEHIHSEYNLENSSDLEHNNYTQDVAIHTETDSEPPHYITVNKHSSTTSGDETIKSTVEIDTNNEISDNGITQGEFHLEGYMINNGDGSSGIRSRSSSLGHESNEENFDNPQIHQNDYSYDNVPKLANSVPIIPAIPLSHGIPQENSQLPGTTTPDLQPQNDQNKQDLTPVKNATPNNPNSGTSFNTPSPVFTDASQSRDDEDDVTGNEHFSRINSVDSSEEHSNIIGDPVDAFESEPTPPEGELRRTRLSEISFIPSSIYSNNRSSSSSSAFEQDDFHRLGKSFSYGSYANSKRKRVTSRKHGDSRLDLDENSIIPSSISIPVQATLITGLDDYGNVPNNSSSSSYSLIYNLSKNDHYDKNHFNNGPLYLESSETLINKTYYLDRSNYNNSNLKKSSNFIKVTRIKTSIGQASKETADKTSSLILARRTPKQAVIVSSTATTNNLPKVVGSVVEAGPAWPGLVSSGIINNRPPPTTYAATATVRPRGNTGTNPTHPTNVINSHIHQASHQQRRLQPLPQAAPPPHQHQLQPTHQVASSLHPQKINLPVLPPTPFQLQQIRTQGVATSAIIDDGNRPVPISSNRNVVVNKPSNNTSISSGSVVRVNKIVNNSNHTTTTDSKAHVISRRLYSSEENVSSSQIKSNSSTGVVSRVHAHISHCPKLHSPTEVICDVHIREGHGIHNPQLTVGWKRKFYNSTQPDILLALNKTPASGENGRFDPHHSIVEVEEGKGERLEEFHDKFNVTLAPGISPMLRSVLLIRSVTAPDCGTYQCEVDDGINVLRSDTLLFLCH